MVTTDWATSLLRPAETARGSGRMTVEIVVCPVCSSLRAGREQYHAGSAMAFWSCRDCHFRWKEAPGVGLGKTARLA